ncbi:MAG: hypothetical protein NTU57_04540 [Candidatus Aenigmarchaeota archaeon]|nr:hypothetical protein [Candidatus Aenigmarchaeota archaeon]
MSRGMKSTKRNFLSNVTTWFFKYRDEICVLLPLVLVALASGIYVHYPVSITNDSAIHSEIVNIIVRQGYPTSWQPYADNGFTYPPLFHYIASIPVLLGLNPVDAVRITGIIIWSLLPLCFYLLGSLYGRKTAMVSASLSILVPFLSNVFIFGEFPQLLAMELLVLEMYFLKRGKYVTSGILAGLGVLCHPFIWIVSLLAYLYYALPVIARNVKAAYILVVPAAVALPWIPKYFQILMNVLSGSWQNVVYNEYQPVFWFWPPETLTTYLFGLNYFTPVIIALSMFGFLKAKDRFIRLFFAATLVFSVYHIPYTQLKIFDTLAIPAVILSSIGITELSMHVKKHDVRYGTAIPVMFLVAMACIQAYHFDFAKTAWPNIMISPDKPLYDAAVWLGAYDGEEVKIYAESAPSWSGALSRKIPLEPEITYLESFSDSYKEQSEANKMIKERLDAGEDVTGIVEKYSLKYMLTKQETRFRKIYEKGGWFVYETAPPSV